MLVSINTVNKAIEGFQIILVCDVKHTLFFLLSLSVLFIKKLGRVLVALVVEMHVVSDIERQGMFGLLPLCVLITIQLPFELFQRCVRVLTSAY